MLDQTISTISHGVASQEAALVAPELILLLECDRPAAGSARHRLGGIDEVVIGRGSARQAVRGPGRLELRVPDGRISSVHAVVRRSAGGFVVSDAGSKNGIVVGGTRLAEKRLQDGDIIECGRTFWRFREAQRRPKDEPDDLDTASIAALDRNLITFCEPLAEQLRSLADVARASIPILILGASGTGKELIARAIHRLSARDGSFVGVNCGALPEHLVEAELFGARRGAFTGATEDRMGLVRSSDGGTLFLDEVGELPLRAQPTLLRVLQEHEVLPIGATRPVPVDLRLVAATHRDLGALAESERFRADLMARICGFIVQLPTLRERLDDFGMLLSALLTRHCQPAERLATVSPEAMRLLLKHPWSLNVRELEHCVRAALALSPARIDVEHLPVSIREPAVAAEPHVATPLPSRPLTPEQLARRAELKGLLAEHQGNISEVARRMGKDRVQIRRWIRLFALSADERESD